MTPRSADEDWDREPEDGRAFEPAANDHDPFSALLRKAADEAQRFDMPSLDADPVEPLTDEILTGVLSANAPPPAPDAAFADIDVSGLTIGEQPVPMIRIHAFCETADNAAMLQRAFVDRRLARAETQVDMGGLDAAIAHAASHPSPDLIILETRSAPVELLAKLDRLAEHVSGDAKVLVIGAANDIALFRELMRRGVSEYLVAPLHPLHMVRAISTLYVNPEKPFAGKTIAVIGAKGGVGASTVAHNLAWQIAERHQQHATIVDFDIYFGTTALDFNQEPQQTIAEALLTPERVDEVFLERVLTRQSERLLLFCAPATLERDLETGPEAFQTVIDRVRRTTPFVIMDLPHGWTPWIRDTLLAADDILIVATPDLASLRNAKNLLDRVKAGRPLDSPPWVALNMVGVPKRPEIPIRDFSEALGQEPTVVIPFEPQVFGTAANNGQMIFEAGPQSKPAAALEQLGARICRREPPPKKKASLLDQISLLKR